MGLMHKQAQLTQEVQKIEVEVNVLISLIIFNVISANIYALALDHHKLWKEPMHFVSPNGCLFQCGSCHFNNVFSCCLIAHFFIFVTFYFFFVAWQLWRCFKLRAIATLSNFSNFSKINSWTFIYCRQRFKSLDGHTFLFYFSYFYTLKYIFWRVVNNEWTC